jgi:hypothetical protein
MSAPEQARCPGGDCFINSLLFRAQIRYVRLKGNANTIFRRSKADTLQRCPDFDDTAVSQFAVS